MAHYHQKHREEDEYVVDTTGLRPQAEETPHLTKIATVARSTSPGAGDPFLLAASRKDRISGATLLSVTEPSLPDGIPRVHYVDELAEAWKVDKAWLVRRIRSRDFAAVKLGRRWAMTEPQIQAALEKMTVPARTREPPPDYGGLTPTSWRRLHRPRPAIRRPDAPVVPPPNEKELPSSFRMVYAAPAAAVAAMPALNDVQRQFLDRVRAEGVVVVNGQRRKTVEALAIRGLVTYQNAYVMTGPLSAYSYRFTVRLNPETT